MRTQARRVRKCDQSIQTSPVDDDRKLVTTPEPVTLPRLRRPSLSCAFNAAVAMIESQPIEDTVKITAPKHRQIIVRNPFTRVSPSPSVEDAYSTFSIEASPRGNIIVYRTNRYILHY